MLSMRMKERIRNSRLWAPILALRASRFERDYRHRRDQYAQIMQDRRLVYNETAAIGEVRARLKQRGYTPRVKEIGQIRTFSIIGEFTWHGALLRSLREIGPVTNCDYTAFDLHQGLREGFVEKRRDFNENIIKTLREEHRRTPFDWVFAYVSGQHILPETLDRIHEEIGIPTVNMCLDDKNCWSTGVAGGQNCGQVDIADAFDLSWTSAMVACGWYLVEGGRPIYMPEGCEPLEYYPRTDRYDVPISFLGASYGCRPVVVRHLRRHGVPVQLYGYGWGGQGQFTECPAEVFSRSQINLGIGGIMFSEELTNVKGRDFDIPCTGGGVYLTTYNPDLAMAFDIGKEILCYQNREEAIEMAMYYLNHPDKCHDIAIRARERCLREHCWTHRFIKLGRILMFAQDNSEIVHK